MTIYQLLLHLISDVSSNDFFFCATKPEKNPQNRTAKSQK
jgi:hypothetical protein